MCKKSACKLWSVTKIPSSPQIQKKIEAFKKRLIDWHNTQTMPSIYLSFLFCCSSGKCVHSPSKVNHPIYVFKISLICLLPGTLFSSYVSTVLSYHPSKYIFTVIEILSQDLIASSITMFLKYSSRRRFLKNRSMPVIAIYSSTHYNSVYFHQNVTETFHILDKNNFFC